MNKTTIPLLFVAIIYCGALSAQPIKLHPQNPHYFQYKDQPRILITSAEHYGAVLNLDFNYRTYLKTLDDEGKEYAYYFEGEGEINVTLHVPAGDYKVEWINPVNGEVISSKHVKSKKELLDLNGPEVKEDVVLKIEVK